MAQTRPVAFEMRMGSGEYDSAVYPLDTLTIP